MSRLIKLCVASSNKNTQTKKQTKNPILQNQSPTKPRHTPNPSKKQKQQNNALLEQTSIHRLFSWKRIKQPEIPSENQEEQSGDFFKEKDEKLLKP